MIVFIGFVSWFGHKNARLDLFNTLLQFFYILPQLEVLLHLFP